MEFSLPRKIALISLIVLLSVIAILLGLAQGLVIAANHNVRLISDFGSEDLALPTRVLDINGELITEFFSDEKREIIAMEDVPENMIFALITREDKTYYQHSGFSLRGFLRAFVYIVLGRYDSGGSTLTMQVAGHLFEDRSDRSIPRKLREIWWSYQLEKVYTKDEILEHYLNKMPFGHGTNGIEAASEFFFGHSAKDNTIAESVLVVIQLAGSGLYSPFRQPENAKEMQRNILNQVVTEGYVTQEEADLSFNTYWGSYDWTVTTSRTPFWDREDKAPFFSEYIRGQLDDMILGKSDIYRDGFTVHTTLNLEYQQIAEDVSTRALDTWNTTYQETLEKNLNSAQEKYVPIIELLTLTYNLPDLRFKQAQIKREAKEMFKDDITPVLDLLGQSFNVTDLYNLSQLSYSKTRHERQQSTVETAMITLENKSGYVLAMIGGSEFSRTNQFNRAVQGAIQPGSAFKPIYYSAGITSRKFTPATHIYDSWEVFYNADGSTYTPQNYRGEWKGDVLLRYALANSMNIPSLKVLQEIGFDAAINRAAELFGMTDPVEIGRIFPRYIPLGLGIIEVNPLQLARAYATFGNNGEAVTPLSIRYIEDRDGNIILNPEEELRSEQAKQDLTVLTPQENYIMVSLLKSVITDGTLSYRWATDHGKIFPMPMAGKTGTTQNWSDAWTCGFSPYYTTVWWAGFDQPGSSLGGNQSGARAVGPFWGEYMATIHRNLEPLDFPKPESGLVEVSICSVSGQLPTEFCDDGVYKEIFLSGTAPTDYCTIHAFKDEAHNSSLLKIQGSNTNENRYNRYNNRMNNNNSSNRYNNNRTNYTNNQNQNSLLDGLDIDLDYLYDDNDLRRRNRNSTNGAETETRDNSTGDSAADSVDEQDSGAEGNSVVVPVVTETDAPDAVAGEESNVSPDTEAGTVETTPESSAQDGIDMDVVD